jgi:hypothetical protein
MARRGPTGEQREGIMRGRAWLGGVGGEGESFVSLEGHSFEHEVNASDGRMVEVLQPAAVQAHVVRGPEGAELFASRG